MIFKCKICGGDLDISDKTQIGTCQYCGSTMTIPILNSERRQNLYDRANHFRRNNEFDKAMSMYEIILNEDKTDAEAYWSIVLCRYGAEFIQDVTTNQRILTCNRTQYTSIFADEDYKQAITYSTDEVRQLYESQANMIDKIQKGILLIAANEEPFDIFICYKELDENGQRTRDSVIAQEIYYKLQEPGYRIFFSKITLENKLGVEYEPYIFSALNSAKVMIVLGTDPKYFESVWVKNEWNRYLKLMKEGKQKVLIPAYKDMDPYDLPEEFSHLQALDMSNIGFIQDLIRGITKIISPTHDLSSIVHAKTYSQYTPSVETALEKAFIHLEYKEWEDAKKQFDYILNVNPKLAKAYIGNLMVELKITTEKDLILSPLPLSDYTNYQKAVRFASPEYRDILVHYNDEIKSSLNHRRVEEFYQEALKLFEKAEISNFEDSLAIYKDISSLMDEIDDCNKSKEQTEQCFVLRDNVQIKINEIQEQQEHMEHEKKLNKSKRKISVIILSSILILAVLIITSTYIVKKNKQKDIKYQQAMELYKENNYKDARILFRNLGNYKESKRHLQQAYYFEAKSYYDNDNFLVARRQLAKILDYKDADKLFVLSHRRLNVVSASNQMGLYVRSDGTASNFGDNFHTDFNLNNWEDIISVSINENAYFGLKSDGTILANGSNIDGECEVSEWKDVIEVISGKSSKNNIDFPNERDEYFTAALKTDGTILITGSKNHNRHEASSWKDITTITSGDGYIAGLKNNGTVVTTSTKHKAAEKWKDIVMIWGGQELIGLKKDGTIVTTALHLTKQSQKEIRKWDNIVSVSTGVNESNSWIVAITSDWITYTIGIDEITEKYADLPNSDTYPIGIKTDGEIQIITDQLQSIEDLDILHFHK